MIRYEILAPAITSMLGPCSKALDSELDRFVLLWLLPPDLFADDIQRRRFLRLAADVVALHHLCLLPLYETGDTRDGWIFQAFAWAEGETLASRLDKQPLKPAVAIDLAAQIASGLDVAHGRGIVHGRLDPSCVLVSSSGEAKLLDLTAGALEERTWADGGGGAGAAWLAPEQRQGLEATVQSDVWGLGAMLYEMVTGVRPRAERREPLRVLRPDLSGDLERIVERALAPSPADRPASAMELRRGLEALTRWGGRPSTAHPPSPPEPSGGMIGNYRILEPLGGGGMGVVHRAEDTRLGRTVALKLLPPELTRDPIAKARFVQEARMASALEHPNLCTIYDAGEADDGRLWLAMPCYDGETLRSRLARGPLPIDEATDVARQVALGLAKAHRQGIVHRDIKPANLMLTGDSVVKILDFGIAKLAGEAGITQTGVAIGTPSYMSPEQAVGDKVDHRADLWALGVVLYEMLAGHRPFSGDHAAAVIEGILHREQESLGRSRPEVPLALQEIVQKLLAKDLDGRYSSAEDVADSLCGAPECHTALVSRPAPRPAWRSWFIGVGALLALFLIVGANGLVVRRWGTTPSASTYMRLTDHDGAEIFPSLSPAGDFFAYAREEGGDQDIFLQRAGGTQEINLTADSPVDDSHPAFSPDGRQIAFWSKRDGGGLFIMGATGEDAHRLTGACHNPSWSPDGRAIACASAPIQEPFSRNDLSQIWRIDVATGGRRLVAEKDAVQPSWSPSGERIAFWGLELGTSRRRIWTVPAEGGPRVPVTQGTTMDWCPVWSVDGRFLFFSSDRSGSMNLWKVRIDERTGQILSDAEAVPIPAPWVGYTGFSGDGRRMVYATRERRSIIEKLMLDSAGRQILGPPVQITRGVRELASMSASPDGTWLVFKTWDSPEDLFLIHPDGSGFRRITDDLAKDRSPVWFPDGQILFSSDRSGKYEAWSIRTDGSNLRQLTATPQPVIHPISSPDGQRIAYAMGYSGRTVWVDLKAPLGRRAPYPLGFPGPDLFFFPYCWSSDGDRLVGATEKTGLVLFSQASGSYRRLTPEGIRPICMRNSPGIAFIDGQGGLSVVDSRTGASQQVLARPDSVRFSSFDLSPDDRWLYLLRTREEGDLWIQDAR